MRTLLVVSATFGATFGVLDVALPAFCSAHGSSQATAGVLLASVGVGSMVGGILYGAREWRWPAHLLYVAFGVAFALAMAPVPLADSVAALAVLLPVAGLFIAPGAAISYGLVGHLTPAGTLTEAFTWETTAVIAGFSLGGAFSGVLVDGPGVRSALVLASGFAAVSAVTSWAGRRTLAA
jgi:predicted MFS family arabinose efflux permease